MGEIYFGSDRYSGGSPTLSTLPPSSLLPPLPFKIDPDFTVPRLPPIRSVIESGAQDQVDEDTENDSFNANDQKRLSADGVSAYDLAPPPPTVSHDNAEYLSGKLFSAEHLMLILKGPAHFHQFRNFLNKYRPQSVPTLVQYLETHKALTAIRYANIVAGQVSFQARPTSRSEAAVVDSRFESFSRRALEELVVDALPAYITYRMVNVVTECLVKEVTGTNTPLMRGLVQGLAEVYCLSDPSLPDCPIVFASEGFFNTTQYGREYIIGKNCRFLQGPKTQRTAVKRISEAISKGQEICEILLNYRRDGSPFLNLVMMAPLMDHHGTVRYFLGCQIDISYLMEEGRGLDSFQQFLHEDNDKAHEPPPDPLARRPQLQALSEFSALLNDEETDIIQNRERRNSIETIHSLPIHANPMRSTPTPVQRKVIGMDEPVEPTYLAPSHFGPSGRLPGVYQNYMLVRPFPSLRIIFTSATLRIPGMSQSRLMDRIGGPLHVREGILDALAQGIGVTAKISWLTQSANYTHTEFNTEDLSNTTRAYSIKSGSDGTESMFETETLVGKPRWIHCTPLQGSDSKPGVIMVIMVDREEITGTLQRTGPTQSQSQTRVALRDRNDNRTPWSAQAAKVGVSNTKLAGSQLYAEYLRIEEEQKPRKTTPIERLNLGESDRSSSRSGFSRFRH